MSVDLKALVEAAAAKTLHDVQRPFLMAMQSAEAFGVGWLRITHDGTGGFAFHAIDPRAVTTVAGETMPRVPESQVGASIASAIPEPIHFVRKSGELACDPDDRRPATRYTAAPDRVTCAACRLLIGDEP